MNKLKYKAGNLLREYSVAPLSDKKHLIGLYFIIEVDEFDAHVISWFDRNRCYTPMTRLEICHTDLHKEWRTFKWEILQ